MLYLFNQVFNIRMSHQLFLHHQISMQDTNSGTPEAWSSTAVPLAGEFVVSLSFLARLALAAAKMLETTLFGSEPASNPGRSNLALGVSTVAAFSPLSTLGSKANGEESSSFTLLSWLTTLRSFDPRSDECPDDNVDEPRSDPGEVESSARSAASPSWATGFSCGGGDACRLLHWPFMSNSSST